MRKTFLIAASVAALAASALVLPALAQGPAPSAPADHSRVGMLFQSDANHDNIVTRAEFDAGRAAHFTRADSNHDGALSREEMRAAHRAMREAHHGDGDHQSRRGHRLDRADANNDGRITREEFLAGPTAMFNRLDANHDGVLAGDERTAQRGEGHRGRRGDRPNIDADNNGSISRAEFEAAGVAMFTRLDANRDGRVTQEEAQAARPPAPPQR